MRKLPAVRRNNVVAGVLAVAMVGSVLVAVLGTDGFRETKVDLNEGGVWVTTPGRVGRINTQIKSIEVAISGGKDVDVAQSGDAVVLFDHVKGQLQGVDVARATATEGRTLPKGATVALGGPVGAVVDPTKGRVWVVDSHALGALDVKTAKAALTTKGKEKALVGAVGLDGVVHVYGRGSREVRSLTLAGPTASTSIDETVADAQITAVGTRAVLLDGRSGKLVVPDGGTVDLSGHGADLVLQQPGPAASEVLVGTDEELLAVPLAGGKPRVLADGGGGAAIQPVRVVDPDGVACAYGAWVATARWARWCEGDDTGVAAVRFSDKAGKVRGGNPLQFRVNRDRVLLNDTKSGVSLPVDEDDPKAIDDWEQALDKDRDDDQEQQESEQKEQAKCSDNPPAPQAKDDRAGTRPERPVIVAVLDNDESDPCDVLSIEPFAKGDLPDPDVATVAVVKEGSAIQVTPAAGHSGEISIRYAALGKGGSSPASLVVDVTPDGQNGSPKLVDDETVVDSGRTVRHNVLKNDTDPDGDALTLTSVGQDPNGGSLQYQANGIVTYTPGGSFVGQVVLPYTVSDGMGGPEAEATGKLTIRVQAGGSNLAPKARNDRLVAFVGKEARIDLLANDTDPNGDRLTLSNLDPVGLRDLGGSFDGNGTLRIKPAEAGRFFVAYDISDGQVPATGQLFVDVREPAGNTPPVAVRDDLVVRPGTPALADLVANDLDAEGDLLAVTSVRVDPTAGLSIELLEMRVARVTASNAFVEPVLISYTVTDGSGTAEGKLVVRPLFLSAENQTPVAVDDATSVRAGNTTAVPVLRNDIDPEGEQLRITKVVASDPTLGRPFVQGDELRFQAAVGNRRPVTLIYTIEDPAGNPASAEVRVDIVAPEQENRPPRAPSVQARVFEGDTVRIRVPLVGLDPDGDTVSITGLSAADPPERGTVLIADEGLVYQADKGARGSDTFAFTVADAAGAETVGSARIVIAPRAQSNTPPSAVPDTIRLAPGQVRSIPVLDNDTDIDGQTLALLAGDVEGPTQPPPGRGTTRLDPGGSTVVYQAPADVGDKPVEVSFTYGVTDGPSSARGVVTVTIDPGEVPNEAPIALDDAKATQLAGSSVVVDVLANDRDPDGDKADLEVEVLGFDTASEVGHGQYRVPLGKQSVSFVYQVTDPGGATAMALVSIPVASALAPVTEVATIKMKAGGTEKVDLLEYVTNPGGTAAALKVTKVIAPTVRGGSTALQGSVVTFNADTDWPRDAGFSYVVSNGRMESVGAVRIVLTGQNQKPTFRPPEITLPEGASREVRLQEYVVDPDSSKHTFAGLSGAVAGKITPSLDGSVLRVEAGLKAKDAKATLTVEVSDGLNEGTMSIPVRIVPNDKDNPTAVTDSAETEEDEPVTIDVTGNDSNPIGKELVVSDDPVVQGGPTVGAALVKGNAVVFTPTSGWFGTALVTYVITDASDRKATGTIRIEVYGRPGVPPAPTGTAESKLVRLQWGVPNRAGTPITGYVVRLVGGGRQETVTSNAAVVDGLTNNTPYQFQVAALNRVVTSAADVREGEWSPASPTLTPDAVPDQPLAPTATFDKARNAGGGGGVLQVAWKAPSVDGSPIKEYTVRVDPVPSGGNPTQTVGAGTTSLQWTGLANGTSYRFSVTATNSAGSNANNSTGKSLESPPSNAEVPAGVPATVTGVKAQRVTDSRNDNGGLALVTWNATADNGDPAGLRYRVTSSPATPLNPQEVDDLRKEWSGLDPATEYQFAVVAHNKAGDAVAPGVSSGVFAEGRPDPPRAPTFLPENGRVALFDFETARGDAKGTGPLSYEYSASEGAGFNALPADGRFSSGNGVTRSVWVRACKYGQNSSGVPVGCGKAKQAVNRADNRLATVTPFAPPTVTSSHSDRTVTWAWGGQAGVDSHAVVGQSGGNLCGSQLCYSQTYGYSDSPCLRVTATGQGVSMTSDPARCETTDAPPPPPYYVGVVNTTEVPITDRPRAWNANTNPSRVVRWTRQGESVQYICEVVSGGYYTNGYDDKNGYSYTWLQVNAANQYIPSIWVTGAPKPRC